MTKLKSAWRVYLNGVRRRFFDHIDDSAVEHVAGALTAVAAQLQDRTPV
jgi:hypothetical protein